MRNEKILNCDLCIPGGGGAGLTAAARAATLHPELKIVVLEKARSVGGGAAQAGDFRVYGSQWQKERGLDDNLSEDLRTRMDETFWELDRKLVLNAFLGTGRFFDWCCTLAPDCADRFVPGRYIFDQPDRGPIVPTYAGLPAERKQSGMGPGGPGPEGPAGGEPGEADAGSDAESGPMPGPGGPGGPGMRTGTYLMKLLKETCQKQGVQILLQTRAVDVEMTGGKISAVLADGPDGRIRINCRAVILATGSWISNPKYLKMASPVFATLDPGRPVPAGHQNCNYTGDGIPLAEKAGALVDYDSFCIRAMGPGILASDGGMVFPRGQMAEAMLRSPFMLQIDEQGRRYTCEPSATRFKSEDAAHILIVHGSPQPFVVFDLNNAKATAKMAREQTQLGSAGGMGGPARVTLTDEQVEADLDAEKFIVKADSIEELAEKLGIPAQPLRETVELYNDSCAKGFDADCFKQPEYLLPLSAPFYGYRTSVNTDGAFGGVQVNADMQALARDGGVVEGLWVPGDFSSGRFVNDRGLKRQIINDLAWAFSSGLIAGENAAAYLTEQSE